VKREISGSGSNHVHLICSKKILKNVKLVSNDGQLGADCGRTNLNYTGSSALILSRKTIRTQLHFKRCNPVVCWVKFR
jgi:hypothetical protein